MRRTAGEQSRLDEINGAITETLDYIRAQKGKEKKELIDAVCRNDKTFIKTVLSVKLAIDEQGFKVKCKRKPKKATRKAYKYKRGSSEEKRAIFDHVFDCKCDFRTTSYGILYIIDAQKADSHDEIQNKAKNLSPERVFALSDLSLMLKHWGDITTLREKGYTLESLISNKITSPYNHFSNLKRLIKTPYPIYTKIMSINNEKTRADLFWRADTVEEEELDKLFSSGAIEPSKPVEKDPPQPVTPAIVNSKNKDQKRPLFIGLSISAGVLGAAGGATLIAIPFLTQLMAAGTPSTLSIVLGAALLVATITAELFLAPKAIGRHPLSLFCGKAKTAKPSTENRLGNIQF